jgi:hypothetical protein
MWLQGDTVHTVHTYLYWWNITTYIQKMSLLFRVMCYKGIPYKQIFTEGVSPYTCSCCPCYTERCATKQYRAYISLLGGITIHMQRMSLLYSTEECAKRGYRTYCMYEYISLLGEHHHILYIQRMSLLYRGMWLQGNNRTYIHIFTRGNITIYLQRMSLLYIHRECGYKRIPYMHI